MWSQDSTSPPRVAPDNHLANLIVFGEFQKRVFFANLEEERILFCPPAESATEPSVSRRMSSRWSRRPPWWSSGWWWWWWSMCKTNDLDLSIDLTTSSHWQRQRQYSQENAAIGRILTTITLIVSRRSRLQIVNSVLQLPGKNRSEKEKKASWARLRRGGMWRRLCKPVAGTTWWYFDSNIAPQVHEQGFDSILLKLTHANNRVYRY